MAWLDDAVSILRVMIWDLDDNPEFCDDRLEQVVMVAATQLAAELPFPDTYEISFSARTVTPDPQDNAIFFNLMVLKSACIIDRGKLRSAVAMTNLEARCGPISMRVGDNIKGFDTLMKTGYCAVYEDTKTKYLFGGVDWCRAVLTPFVNSQFFPSDFVTNYYDRMRYAL